MGDSLRRSGRAGSIRSRPRIGFSLESEFVPGSMRVGRAISLFVSVVVEGLRSGLSSDDRDGAVLSPASPRSIGWRSSRAGRVTAPVGRASFSPPEVVVFTVGVAGLASRPLNTRDRRSSSSSGTPGVRVDAPVDVDADGSDPILACPLELPLVLVAASAVGGRAGKPVRKGASVIARLASASSALLARKSALPICLALAVVTARSCTGFKRRRFANSSERKAVRRPGWL